jgi:O-antigen/teichoic acid export membrane protein
MVHGLGLTSYGIYSVAFSVTALGSYLDLGLGWTTSKFVAEGDAMNSQSQIGTAVAASATYHLVVGLVFAVVVIASASWISVALLRMAEGHAEVATAVIRITAVSFVASSLNGVFVSVLRGLRRFAAATLIATGATTISVVGAAAAAWLGFGVVAAASAQLIGAVCGLLAGLIACYGILKASERGRPLWQQLRAMLGFSIWNYATRLIQMLAAQVDKILIARWMGPGVLTFYNVPFNFAQRVNFLAGPAVTAIYPVAAFGQLDRKAFIKQYLAASRLLHMMTGAVAIAVLVWGDRFLAAWVGTEMAEQGTFFLRVLTIGFWIVSVGSFDGGCVEGWNKPRLTLAISAVAGTVGLAMVAAMRGPMGSAKAIALGVASYFVVAGLGQMLIWYRMSRYSATFVLRRVGLPVAEMCLLGTVVSILLRRVVQGRAVTIAALFAMIASLAVYGIVRAFSAAELRVLAERVTAPFTAA